MKFADATLKNNFVQEQRKQHFLYNSFHFIDGNTRRLNTRLIKCVQQMLFPDNNKTVYFTLVFPFAK